MHQRPLDNWLWKASPYREGSWISVHGRGSYVNLIPHICCVPYQISSGMFLGYTRYLSVRTCKKSLWCDEIFSGLYCFSVEASVDLYSIQSPLKKFQCNLTFSPATVSTVGSICIKSCVLNLSSTACVSFWIMIMSQILLLQRKHEFCHLQYLQLEPWFSTKFNLKILTHIYTLLLSLIS